MASKDVIYQRKSLFLFIIERKRSFVFLFLFRENIILNATATIILGKTLGLSYKIVGRELRNLRGQKDVLKKSAKIKKLPFTTIMLITPPKLKLLLERPENGLDLPKD